MPSDQSPNQQPNSNKTRRRPAPTIGGNWIWLVVLVVLVLFLMASPLSTPKQIHWSEFYYLIEKDQLKEVVQVGDRYEGELKDDVKKKLKEGNSDLPDELRPRHVHGGVDGPGLGPRIVLEDLHHQRGVVGDDDAGLYHAQ